MRKNNCEEIRRELDELMLDEACGASVVEHLQECSACREFHRSQTKLRQIVGSLGTVAAPADFDFRLRARLANDSSSAAFHLKSAYWPFARRGFAFAALLLVFAAGVVVVRNIVNQQGGVDVVADQSPTIQQQSPKPVETPAETVESLTPNRSEELTAAVQQTSPKRIRSERPSQTGSKSRRSIVAIDFSSERAEVVSGLEPFGSGTTAVFPIDASLQSLKVSLDDGRGNARTISVPTISFGSQRMLPNGNQFAQKGVW